VRRADSCNDERRGAGPAANASNRTSTSRLQRGEISDRATGFVSLGTGSLAPAMTVRAWLLNRRLRELSTRYRALGAAVGAVGSPMVNAAEESRGILIGLSRRQS